MKNLTKAEMEEIKKGMENGIAIPAYCKNNNIEFTMGDLKNIASQMIDNFGNEEFSRVRGKVRASNKENRKNGKEDKVSRSPEMIKKRLHRNYSSVIEKVDSTEFVDSCISDLQELLVLCEVKKTELSSKG